MQNSINERIRDIANIVYSGNITAMSKSTLISRTTINSIIGEKEVYPGYEVIRKIAEISSINISLDWLITGKGSMIKNEAPKPEISYSSGRPYYNVDFIGGFDLILNNQSINPDYNIDFQPYNKDGVMWCNLTGHSMEPEISNGDMMAIKEVKDWDKYLTMNETYAIVTKNDLRTVKKVRKGSDKNHLTLVPVNKEYDEQEIAKEMILRVFLVLGCMKRF